MKKKKLITAEKIFYNGIFYSMNETQQVWEAVAVKGQYILCVGTREEVFSWRDEHTEIIDLGGKVVIPGLIEGHLHLMQAGEVAAQVPCFWLPKDVILANVAARVRTLKPGQRIKSVFGWNNEVWEDTSYPSKEELDAVAPENPVSLGRCDGHMIWVNSKALEIAGITEETKNPQGGEIMRKKDGSVLGCLSDNACTLVMEKIPPMSLQEREEALLCAQEELFQWGITSVMAMCVTKEHMEAIKSVYEKGKLKLRISCALGGLPGESDGGICEEYYRTGPVIEAYDQHLNVRAIKYFADGSFGAQSGALYEDYSDRPGHSGKLNHTDEEMEALVEKAHKKGFQVITHAIGDRANQQILDAYETVLKKEWNPDHRFRIEHFQLVNEKMVKQTRDLGVLVGMQAIHAPKSGSMADRRIGTERAVWSYASGIPYRAGIKIIGGSDAPSSPGNPFWGIYAACTRKDEYGKPESGWYAQNCIPLLAAVKSYTNWAAYGQFEEHIKGSVEAKKLADFIVLDRDIFTCPTDEIKEIKVLRTVLGGETVYQSK